MDQKRRKKLSLLGDNMLVPVEYLKGSTSTKKATKTMSLARLPHTVNIQNSTVTLQANNEQS